jgi:cyclopropane fatty-acyl-phospholipid synthase-like methyltransferase
MPAQQPRQVVDPALLNATPATRWTNLGWWGDADPNTPYADAAHALAWQVGRAAGLRTGDIVVDIACGHGDSLRLWVEAFGVARVIGVEPDAALGAAIRARVAAWGLGDRITVHTATAEEFDLARIAPDATAIVCVDAAYHFRTRAAWLRGLAATAAPGTRLGFTDLALHEAPASSRVLWFAERAGIPAANLWSIAEIPEALQTAGFAEIDVTDIGTAVIDGFRAFVSRARLRWLRRPRSGGWALLVTAWMLGQVRPALTMVAIGARSR